MVQNFRCYFLWLLVGFSPLLNAKSYLISIPEPRSVYDISHDYHVQLLHLALHNAGLDQSDINIQQVPAMSPGRAQLELKKGQLINLYWLGAEQVLHNDLIAIEVPTTRGLIGFRKFIINQSQVAEFNKIKAITDLKSKIACQGQHWPDTQILNAAGLPVTTSANYENLFKMVALNRCDYFPRGYHDALQELTLRKATYPALIRYDDIMLHYPFAVYFYVAKTAPELAERLAMGMHKAAELGQINQLMQTHPLTKAIFPLKRGKPNVFLTIDNPSMTFKNIHDRRYWITAADFEID